MPLFDYICKEETCDHRLILVERFLRSSDPDPSCQRCGGAMNRVFSPFAVTFTGPITTRYNDRKLEGAHKEGHWLWCKNTPDGKPRREWVDTWEKRKTLMKQEKLEDGGAGQVEVNSEGCKASGMGLPGAWQ